MKQIKTLVLGIAATAGVLVPLADANAWVAQQAVATAAADLLRLRRLPRRRLLPSGLPPDGLLWMRRGGRCRRRDGGRRRRCQRGAPDHGRRRTTGLRRPASGVRCQGNVPIGTQYAALPSGAQSMVVNGVNYYQSGPTWYKPYFAGKTVSTRGGYRHHNEEFPAALRLGIFY